MDNNNNNNNNNNNYIQPNPSEANSFLPSQEAAHILSNPKVNYQVQNSSALVSVLNQIDLAHAVQSNFCDIHFNISFPSKPGSSMWSLHNPTTKPCIIIIIIIASVIYEM
jgi:hypothetical protein